MEGMYILRIDVLKLLCPIGKEHWIGSNWAKGIRFRVFWKKLISFKKDRRGPWLKWSGNKENSSTDATKVI